MIPNVELLDEDQLKTLEAFIQRRIYGNYVAEVVGLWKTDKHVYADIAYSTTLVPGYITHKEKRYYVAPHLRTHYSGRKIYTKSRWKLVG